MWAPSPPPFFFFFKSRDNKFQQSICAFETISPKVMNHLSTVSAPHVIREHNWANISWLHIVHHHPLAFFTSLFTIYHPISKSVLHISVSSLPLWTSLINWVLNDYSWLWMNRNENNYKSNLGHHSWSIIKFGLSLFSLTELNSEINLE